MEAERMRGSLEDNASSSMDDGSHQLENMKKILEFYKSNRRCDVTLIAAYDQVKVRAHRIVLYAASSYFRALLSGPWANVNQETHTVGEISGHTLNAIVSYCYTGRIDIDADNIYEIAVNASMMNLVKLESWCEQYLANSMRLMNCVDLIQFGELYNMRHLKAKGIEMALLQFQHLMKFDEFLEMRVESLEELLASDHLFVYSEEVAYDAAIQWIRHDATNRKQFFARLVLLVRLEQIKSPFVLDNVRQHSISLNAADQFGPIHLRYRNLERSSDLSTTRLCARHPILMACQRGALYKLNYVSMVWEMVLKFESEDICEHIQIGKYAYFFEEGLCFTGGKCLRLDLSTWESIDVKTTFDIYNKKSNMVHLNGYVYFFVLKNVRALAFKRYDTKRDEMVDLVDWRWSNPAIYLTWPNLLIAAGDKIYGFFSIILYSYDLNADKWSPRAYIPSGRNDRDAGMFRKMAFIYNGDLYLIMCCAVLEIYRYDEAADDWIDMQMLEDNWITQTLIDVHVHNDRLYICARKKDDSGDATISIYSVDLRNGSRHTIGSCDHTGYNAYFQTPY